MTPAGRLPLDGSPAEAAREYAQRLLRFGKTVLYAGIILAFFASSWRRFQYDRHDSTPEAGGRLVGDLLTTFGAIALYTVLQLALARIWFSSHREDGRSSIWVVRILPVALLLTVIAGLFFDQTFLSGDIVRVLLALLAAELTAVEWRGKASKPGKQGHAEDESTGHADHTP